MTRDEAIKTLTETPDLEEIRKDIQEIKNMMSLFLQVIVVQQKDVCEAVGVSPDTVRSKVLRGETEILQRDGSRLNYLTLEKAGELKKRKVRRK